MLNVQQRNESADAESEIAYDLRRFRNDDSRMKIGRALGAA